MQDLIMLLIAVIVLVGVFELHALHERYKMEIMMMDIDDKVEEVLLMLTRINKQGNPKLVRVGDVIDVLSAELDIPISDLVAGMDIVPGVKDLD